MNRNSINVGKKIKTYRKAKKYTLKNLAEKTGLSIGFLSQLERGMTTIAIDSLFNLANVLDVDIMDFFDAAPKSCDDPVVHSYSRPVLSAAPETVQFYLGGAQDHNFQIVPKLLQLMPSQRYLMCPEQPAGCSRGAFCRQSHCFFGGGHGCQHGGGHYHRGDPGQQSGSRKRGAVPFGHQCGPGYDGNHVQYADPGFCRQFHQYSDYDLFLQYALSGIYERL